VSGYAGGIKWGVRWGEAGTPVKVFEYRDEEAARSMYKFLLKRYEELGRPDRPQLVAARIHWQPQEPFLCWKARTDEHGVPYTCTLEDGHDTDCAWTPDEDINMSFPARSPRDS
jgi:hypothetical protein